MWIDDSSDSDSAYFTDYSESSSDSESEKSADQDICSDYEITSADLNIDIPDEDTEM